MAATYSPVPIAIGMVRYHRQPIGGLTLFGMGRGEYHGKTPNNQLKLQLPHLV